jgi:prepilin-type processing-associated H-X9-DG protein
MTLQYPQSYEATWFGNIVSLPHGSSPDPTVITTAMIDYAGSNFDGVSGSSGVIRPLSDPQAPMRIRNITDGLSNTLLVGEKALYRPNLGQLQVDDDQGYTVGSDHDTMRHTDRAPTPDYSEPSLTGTTAYTGTFGSSHPNLFQVVFADGSVHQLSVSIDTTVFSYLGNVSDGHAISAGDY